MMRFSGVAAFASALAGVSIPSTAFAEELQTQVLSQPDGVARAPGSDPVGHAIPASNSASNPGERARLVLDEYRARELHTRFSYWSGQEVFRGDRPADLGYFGGGSDDVFAGSQRALDSISTYRTMRIAGTTAYAVGLGLLITDLVLLLTRSNSVVRTDSQGEVDSVKPLAWGLLVSGGVLGIGGAVAMQGANAYLSDAVDHYNADLANRVKAGAGNSQPRRAMITFRGTF